MPNGPHQSIDGSKQDLTRSSANNSNVFFQCSHFPLNKKRRALDGINISFRYMPFTTGVPDGRGSDFTRTASVAISGPLVAESASMIQIIKITYIISLQWKEEEKVSSNDGSLIQSCTYWLECVFLNLKSSWKYSFIYWNWYNDNLCIPRFSNRFSHLPSFHGTVLNYR